MAQKKYTFTRVGLSGSFSKSMHFFWVTINNLKKLIKTFIVMIDQSYALNGLNIINLGNG